MYYRLSVLSLGVLAAMCLWAAEKGLCIMSWQGAIAILGSLGIFTTWIADSFTRNQAV